MKFVIYIFLFYLLYKFLTGVALPVYKTTKQMKSHMRTMQEKMQEQERRQEEYQKAETKHSDPGGDYIDYEEVK